MATRVSDIVYLYGKADIHYMSDSCKIHTRNRDKSYKSDMDAR